MNQAELQQDLQRLATEFQSRVAQGGLALADQPQAQLRDNLLQQALLYESSILDIATGPYPEINLLDMTVFAELNADLLQRHWMPEVWGVAGSFFDDAFRALKAGVWEIVRGLFSTHQQQQLYLLIREWEAKNPEQLRVEGLRLSSFARFTGEPAARAKDGVHGLFGSARSAIQSADEALLLGERALFLVQRAPFLLRAHVRLSARELMRDMKGTLNDGRSIDALVRGWIIQLGLVGAACSMIFWGGYAVARRLAQVTK
jgi:hypothetical protein